QENGRDYRLVDPQVFYLNPFQRRYQRNFPVASYACRGGILADEMGMGKTVELLALLLASKASQDEAHQIDGPTLVICPTSMIGQWRMEIERRLEYQLKVAIYHGSKKNAFNLRRQDIVITSYGTAASEWQSDSSTFTAVHWGRIICDEAHVMRNQNTLCAKALSQLKAQSRWAVTGTPLQNKLDDLHALLRFLRLEPWNDLAWWKNAVKVPYEKGDKSALTRLKTVLHPIMLRRTKDMKDSNGTPIVELPAKTVQVVTLKFSDQEREFFSALKRHSRLEFDGIRAAGKV
ncbi:unnamed protein product, partial [Chrysoparadoxa australica]